MSNNFADLRGDAPEKARNTTECRGDRKSPADFAQWSAGDASAERELTPDDVRSRRVTAIKKEKSRLAKQFKEIDKKSRAVVDGLIEQAAFRVTTSCGKGRVCFMACSFLPFAGENIIACPHHRNV